MKNSNLWLNSALLFVFSLFLALVVLFLSTSSVFNPAIRTLLEQQNMTEEQLARFFQTAVSIQDAQQECLEQYAKDLNITLPVDPKSIDLQQYHTLNEQTLLCLDTHITQLQEQDASLFLHPLGASVLLTQMRRTALSASALGAPNRLEKTHALYAKWSPQIDTQRILNEKLWNDYYSQKEQLSEAQSLHLLQSQQNHQVKTQHTEKQQTLQLMAQMHQTLAQDIVQPKGALQSLETPSEKN